MIQSSRHAHGFSLDRKQYAAGINHQYNYTNSKRTFGNHCSVHQNSSRPFRGLIIARVWQQVIDQASGKPYYWNTATNETAWELPSGAVDTSSSSSSTVATADTTQPQQQQHEGTQEGFTNTSMSYDMLYSVLLDAYNTDGSGMHFWEVARAHRGFGVFDPPFVEYLEQKQKTSAGVDEAGKDMAFKIMCRLSNPLLRQPAPFEF